MVTVKISGMEKLLGPTSLGDGFYAVPVNENEIQIQGNNGDNINYCTKIDLSSLFEHYDGQYGVSSGNPDEQVFKTNLDEITITSLFGDALENSIAKISLDNGFWNYNASTCDKDAVMNLGLGLNYNELVGYEAHNNPIDIPSHIVPEPSSLLTLALGLAMGYRALEKISNKKSE